MTRKPVVAIAHCRRLDDYIESIRRAGGDPRVLNHASDPLDRVLDEVDGLLLTGGADIDPALYGEDRHPAVEEVEPGRDHYEIALVNGAIDRDLPVLGICRGLQVLNVARGGSLIQDISSERPSDLKHSVRDAKEDIAHTVSVTSRSRLAQALGRSTETPIGVNSRHHQAVGRLAPDLVVSGVSPDGIVEAVERPASRFCLAVQWHPENSWGSGAFAPLFESFIAACARQQQSTRP
ncbi:MAG: gamma-glutamyl-gamma-aminobutyrate hydrolase family protein [Acidobacteria bacterium]|nr:gamma-glutamyl-gamma-aminobutyrate hydrolase family protein [Acidobacteriota bacterium]